MPVDALDLVLIVEDEPLILGMMEDEFRDQGFEVIGAIRAAQAIEALESNAAIDALFTDVRLPGAISGWALAAQARALRPGMPILYATGYSDENPPDINPVHFFLKPYSVDAVVRAVKRCLGHNQRPLT